MTGARRGKEDRPLNEHDPNSGRSLTTALLTVGGAMAATLLVILFFMSGMFDQLLEAFEPAPTPALSPPAVTPIPSGQVPAEPATDGTTATIRTELGDIVVELFTESAPVASRNFISLAEAGFYRGVGFHRIIPGFMIQGGDPTGTGSGGPGYTIPDEPVVGEYERGMVAMARSAAPNSQGSQFFILVADAEHLEGGGYTIFGQVLSGMEVADEIVQGQRTGPQQDQAVEPVQILDVTVATDI